MTQLRLVDESSRFKRLRKIFEWEERYRVKQHSVGFIRKTVRWFINLRWWELILVILSLEAVSWIIGFLAIVFGSKTSCP